MLGSFCMAELHASVTILGSVAGTTFEEIIVGFDIGGEVNHFASRQLLDCIEHNGVTMMIGTFPVTSEPNAANVFAAFGSVRRGDFIFGEDGGIRAFGHAGAAINAGVRVNIDPREFIDGVAGHHTFYGANVNAAAVTNA